MGWKTIQPPVKYDGSVALNVPAKDSLVDAVDVQEPHGGGNGGGHAEQRAGRWRFCMQDFSEPARTILPGSTGCSSERLPASASRALRGLQFSPIQDGLREIHRWTRSGGPGTRWSKTTALSPFGVESAVNSPPSGGSFFDARWYPHRRTALRCFQASAFWAFQFSGHEIAADDDRPPACAGQLDGLRAAWCITRPGRIRAGLGGDLRNPTAPGNDPAGVETRIGAGSTWRTRAPGGSGWHGHREHPRRPS